MRVSDTSLYTGVMFKEIVDRLFVVAGAVLFSQWPLFMQEYQQRLAGHIEELKVQLKAIGNVAAQSGKSIDQFIQKFISSSDQDFSNQGALMHAMQQRLIKLSDGLSGLQGASPLTKPFIFLKQLDIEIAKGCFGNFKPGVLFTAEGVCYTLVGMAAGYLLFKLLGLLLIGKKRERQHNE